MVGISGSLIPSGFLSDVFPKLFATDLDRARADVPRTTLVRWWHRVARQLGPASSARSILDVAALPLVEALGFEPCHAEPLDGAFCGLVECGGGRRVLLLVLPWGNSPDRWWRETQQASRSAGAAWALVITGRSLHLVDTARSWSRRSIDFDLEQVMLDERAVWFLWALASARAVCANLDAIVRAADDHAEQVCDSLGEGVLASLGALLTAMRPSPTTVGAAPRVAFDQALTVVYRVLFLLFAEARAVVPTWHPVYREAYTIDTLCRRLVDRPQAVGLWESLLAISRLAHAGCRAGDLHVTAFNGRLFSPRHSPLVERSRVPDAVVREAILALGTQRSPSGRRRIAYADLGVEQLGAVYERVLEYEAAAPQAEAPLVLRRTSLERKSTGSFYTPRSITEFLVRRTLHPLVSGRSADEILALRIVDPSMGSGAFLVAACRFLSRAVEQARVAAGEWNAHDSTPEYRADVRRTVAQRCLYGVDLNPTAVQLARLSLWLTTLTTDRPLTFLDHHLASGDSLVGASLDDIARQPPGEASRSTSPAVLPLFESGDAADMAAVVLPERFRIANEPADTTTAVHEKERALRDLDRAGTPLARWKAAADLWCAGWFWPDRSLTRGVYADVLSGILARTPTLKSKHATALLERAAAVARAQQAFHWHLEFPEVFFGPDGSRRPDGGFDAVLGNPPWDVMRSDTGSRETRENERSRQDARLRFFRRSGVYQLVSTGHANRYQLFVERALQLLKPGGRLGLILPSGLATDHGSAALRRALLDSTRIERIQGFSNREAIFPIHRDVRFLLLTATTGDRTEQLACRFGLRSAAWLDTLPDNSRDDPAEARGVVLSRRLIERCDPERQAIPELDDARDLEILAQVIETIPKLADGAGWGVRFGRELNATDDRPHFQKRRPRSHRLLPIIEGKHVEPFRVKVSDAAQGIAVHTAAKLLGGPAQFGRARLAYRDVASATNRLTLIAGILPAGTISTHTVFCAKSPLDEASQYCLLALVNSLVANYLVRLQVTTHVTASLMARLPVPVPERDSRDRRALVRFARELERTGVEANVDAYARLNAMAARAYGLTRTQYEHVVMTFPLLSAAVRARCVAAYQALGAATRRLT